MTDVLDFEITLLSPDEAKNIWKAQTKRAPDFQRYQQFIDAREVGDSFSLPVPDSDPENARAIQYNFNEAAKHRNVYFESQQGAEGAFQDVDGEWVVARPEPVVLRWRRDTRDVKEIVSDGNGASGEVDVRKVDRLRALVVSTESVSKRGPRKRTNVTSDTNGTTATTASTVSDSAVSENGATPQTDSAQDAPQNAPQTATSRRGRTAR